MGCNISPRREAETAVKTRAGAKFAREEFKVIHEDGTGGWKHAVAVDPTTGAHLRDGKGEILSAYRPILGDR